LKEQRLDDGVEMKRLFYGKKIRSNAHLVNTAVYLMTERTVGGHLSVRSQNKHFAHEMPTTIQNMTVQRIFKEDLLYPRIPELKKAGTSWRRKLTKERKQNS
jgi:hypothetical protein